MGSSGGGRFSAYQVERAGTMGNGEQSDCPLKIENISLEDVAISEYYLHHDSVPVIGEAVELSIKLINKRLVVVLSDTQEVIGNMPVLYNMLFLCIKKGYKYSGTIKGSGLVPIPYVVVNLYA